MSKIFGNLHCFFLRWPLTFYIFLILKNISQIAYEDDCFKHGKADLLRWVPCPTGKICKEDEDVKPHKIIPGYQFTLRVEEPLTPQYW